MRLMTFVWTALLLLLTQGTASADQEQRARDLLQRAVDYYRVQGDTAFAAFSRQGEFIDGEHYVFVVDTSGTMLASGGTSAAWIGRDVTEALEPEVRNGFRQALAGAEAAGAPRPIDAILGGHDHELAHAMDPTGVRVPLLLPVAGGVRVALALPVGAGVRDAETVGVALVVGAALLEGVPVAVTELVPVSVDGGVLLGLEKNRRERVMLPVGDGVPGGVGGDDSDGEAVQVALPVGVPVPGGVGVGERQHHVRLYRQRVSIWQPGGVNLDVVIDVAVRDGLGIDVAIGVSLSVSVDVGER
jgi:hypothetical protein